MHFSNHVNSRLKAIFSVFTKTRYYPACFIDRTPFGGYFVVFLRYYSIDADMASVNWRGVPISEIIGSQSPWGAPEFPLVIPSRYHTVLYNVSNDGNIGDRPPKPHRGHDIWDNGHVRLPCSNKSLYPVEDVRIMLIILSYQVSTFVMIKLLIRLYSKESNFIFQ